VVRFVNDILLSAPSIVIGLFVYAIVVADGQLLGHGPGARAGLIVIPVVVRTTENMLLLVPNSCARRLSRWDCRSGR
jgi:phosphate transport system permease protein